MYRVDYFKRPLEFHGAWCRTHLAIAFYLCLFCSSALLSVGDVQAQASWNYLVETNQAGAAVYLDGKLVGVTRGDGTLPVSVTPGLRTFRVEKEGFVVEPARHAVEVARGGVSRTIRFTLETEPPPWWQNWQALLFAALLALCAALALTLAFVLLRRERVGELNLTTTFDRYEVIRTIGRGGMATVFLARDRHAGQTVALKVMDANLVHDTDLARKFIREGEALQRITGTYPTAPVVRALRYGREHNEEGGRPFVALEYLDGKSLLQVLQSRGRLPLPQALSAARQVAEGLAAAHAHGIWHRDISPDNVFVIRYDGHQIEVKLIDFGVAKNEYTLIHTLDGSITGKPAYMSPEQCRGESLDGRTDLYSLGALLYALLAGHPPFSDPNPLLVMRLHESAPVPSLPSDVAQPVRELVYRLLSKRREDRPATATELVAVISALEQMEPIPLIKP